MATLALRPSRTHSLTAIQEWPTPLTLAHFDGHVSPGVFDHDVLGLSAEDSTEVALANRLVDTQPHHGVVSSVRKVSVAMGLQ